MHKISVFASLVDKYLSGLVVVLLILVVAVQACFALVPGVGVYFNYALRIEGGSVAEEEIIQLADGISPAPWASLSITLQEFISLPGVTVLINGKEVGSFTKNNLTLNVKQGDILVINNPYSYDVTVQITKTTPNIAEPKLQSQVNGTGLLYFDPVVIE
ncbi:MAG: hypothetical protein WAO24_04055 [Peptococcia bacterium]